MQRKPPLLSGGCKSIACCDDVVISYSLDCHGFFKAFAMTAEILHFALRNHSTFFKNCPV